MTKKERMLAAFRHEPVDRIPAGELSIHQNLAARTAGCGDRAGSSDRRHLK